MERKEKILLACWCLVCFILLGWLTSLVIIEAITPDSDPSRPYLHVHGASASMFELDGGGGDDAATLRYNLGLNVSVCNEDLKSTYLVYHVTATALYAGVPLRYAALVGEPLLLPPTYGCIPTVPPLRPALFRGETALPTGSEAAVMFRREEGDQGLFTLDVHLQMLVMKSSDEGNPGDDGLEFSKLLAYTVDDARVKLHRPESSPSLLHVAGSAVPGHSPALPASPRVPRQPRNPRLLRWFVGTPVCPVPRQPRNPRLLRDLGLVDQIIHSAENIDIVELLKHLHPKVLLGIPLLEGTNPASCFPRFAIGYEATCYSYIWSEVFATDIFASKFQDDLLNQYSGLQFRNKVFAPGGARDTLELLCDYLGREPSIQPFIERKTRNSLSYCM